MNQSILNKIIEYILENEEDFFYKNENNLGINSLSTAYIEINEHQNIIDEYRNINIFLNDYLLHYSKNNNIDINDLSIKFINYGKTELVYVLTVKGENKITLLVKQPAIPFGKIKQEADNLIELKKYDDNVISPIDYYNNNIYELYTTEYINQARCIASDKFWGMYIPEPFYRFEPFTKEQEKVVCTCMIAKLVSLYDFKNEQGISCCKLGGGDFMLPKGWENNIPTIENTLNNLYLIAAREKINYKFKDYLKIIREEFSRITINDNQKDLIINLRGRVPMNIDYINAGIELGQTIIENDYKNIKQKLLLNK